MTSAGRAHPLDVELAGTAGEGAGEGPDPARVAEIEAHVGDCLPCHIKLSRLREAGPATGPVEAPTTPPRFAPVPHRPAPGPPSPGQLRLASPPDGNRLPGGAGDFLTVVVLDEPGAGGAVVVAPVTFDAEAASPADPVLDGRRSPLGLPLAVHLSLAAPIPVTRLGDLVGSVAPEHLGTSAAPPTVPHSGRATTSDLDVPSAATSAVTPAPAGPSAPNAPSAPGGSGPGTVPAPGAPSARDHAGTGADPSAAGPAEELRQWLVEAMEAVGAPPAYDDGSPGRGGDARTPTAVEQARARLAHDLRTWRGSTCDVRPTYSWPGVVAAERLGWEPLLTVDEVGVVVVVLWTPHGLSDDADFDAGRSVLTRLNATALVVLAPEVSEHAEVFDAPALSSGITTPSGALTPPRPLIAGLAPVDALAKFLDQSTGGRAPELARRGAVQPLRLDRVLDDAASAALADAARQAGRFKIQAKRRGYEAASLAHDELRAALHRAMTGESVVPGLVAPRPGDGPGPGEDAHT
ncbi:MAG: hypothetical protein AB1673_05220 [Actinomycetota bacterium]